MAKRRKQVEETSGLELLILALFVWLICQATFTDNVERVGHQAFERMGVVDEIERLDSYIQNR